MTIRAVSSTLLACALVVSAAVAPAAQPREEFSSQALSALPRAGWLTNGGNLANQRFSPLDAINRDNVGKLKGVWRTHLNGSGSGRSISGAAQPIVHDGRIYLATGANDVFALDADSGAILWQYSAQLDPKISTVCCGWTNRGVGIGDDKLFFGTARWPSDRARPADRQGGLVGAGRAMRRTASRSPARRCISTASSSPALPAPSTACADASRRSMRGTASCCGRSTRFPGRASRVTTHGRRTSNAWQRGGGTVWQTPAVDPELGLIYFSTGNAGPDFNGAVRPGDNLFTVVDRRHRSEDRQVPLALPAGAPRHLGLRRAEPRHPVRRARRRPAAQGPGGGRQDRLGVHPRPRDRRAADRHRRTRRAAGAAPGHRGDAALSARRRDRSAARRHRARGLCARQRRPHLHAVLRQCRPDREPEPVRRRQLAAELPTIPLRQHLFVCASDVPGNFIGGGDDAEPAGSARNTSAARWGSRPCPAAASSPRST